MERSMNPLKIHPHRHIQHRLLIKKSIHLPAGIEPQEITQQCTAHPKPVATRKRADTSRLQQDIQIRIGRARDHFLGPLECIVLPIPGRSQVKELYEREIAEKSIIDRLIEERRKYGKPELTV